MSEQAARRMTEAEFLECQRGEERRYELVDGTPHAMTGARVRHDIARGNAEGHLRAPSAPRLVFKVLSEGTRRFDEYIKLDEYKGMEVLDYIILMAPTDVDVAVRSRDTLRVWQRDRYRSLDVIIPLPALGVSLPLVVLYEGIEFRPEFPNAVDNA